MKKTVIVVILVVMASALVYKYFSKPSSNNLKPISVQNQNTEEGAQLPPEAKKSISESDIASAAVCSKNIDSIIEDFTKIWDPAPDKNKKPLMINSEDSTKISDMLASYGACIALASMDRGRCDSLPGKKNGGLIFFPRERCRFEYDEVAFSAFAAGKYKKEEVCSDFISSHRIPKVVKANVLCSAAKKGVENICQQFEGRIPPDAMDGCLRTFPKSIDSCSEDNCRDFFKISEAFSSGQMDKCPPNYREHCDALSNSSEASCRQLKNSLINTYCAMYNKAVKKAEEEAKKIEEMNSQAKLIEAQNKREYEERKKAEAEKAAQEKMKEKLKRMQEEDNKKIKEMLEKLGSNE